MIIEIKVVPAAKKNQVLNEEGTYKVYLTASPQDGKANKALIALLAEYFDVKKRQVEIIKGLKSRHKTINIDKNI